MKLYQEQNQAQMKLERHRSSLPLPGARALGAIFLGENESYKRAGLTMRMRDLDCTVRVPTQGTLDMIWPQWG